MNNSKKYQCIVSDLDDTLLDKSGKLTPGLRKALVHLMEQGILFVPASGRPFFAFPEDVLRLPGLRYAIASNGVCIYNVETGEIVSCLKVAPYVAPELIRALDPYYLTYEGMIDGVAYTSRAYYDDPVHFGAAQKAIPYVQRTRIPVDDIEQFLLDNQENLDCINVIVRQEIKEEVTKLIQSLHLPVYITTSAKQYIELSDLNSGKHSGIARLTELLEIKQEEVVAFGDGDNDHEMLEWAGLGIAVENATELCKKYADEITSSHAKDGVLKSLMSIFGGSYVD